MRLPIHVARIRDMILDRNNRNNIRLVAVAYIYPKFRMERKSLEPRLSKPNVKPCLRVHMFQSYIQ